MRRVVLWAALLGLSTGTGAFAQAAGSLAGVVVDASTQNPLPGAVVTVHSPALLGEQAATTDGEGAFEMTLLPAGTYGLTVRRDGFQPYAPEGLVLKGKKVRIKLAIVPVPAAAPPPSETAVEFTESMTAPAMIS